LVYHNFRFTKDGCNILTATVGKKSSKLIGCGYRQGNLYYLPAEPVSSFSSSTPKITPVDNTLLAWHVHLSHIGLRPLKQMLRTNNITLSISNEIKVQQCTTCVQCKMSRNTFKHRQAHRSTNPGQLIHLDVGCYKVNSREGYKYFITFIDKCSKACLVYPMKYKSSFFNFFKILRALFEKSKTHTIRAL
jgi:hypothetical protein